MTEYIIVQTTIDSKEAAQKIAEVLVNKRLAACAQVSGPMTSTYWWQGKLEQSQEWKCTAKTRKELYNELEQAIRENHSYDTPEILATSVAVGIQSYLNWISEETDSALPPLANEKEELLRQFDTAHDQLLKAATSASTRGITQQGSQWGPREVVAHIVGWSVEATERLPRVIAGEPPLKYDDEAFNVAIITVLGDQPFDVVVDMLRQAHQRYMQLLRAQDEKVFEPGHPVFTRIQAVIEHLYEHTRSLDALE